MSDCIDYFLQIPNLTGLGIRISVYAQSTILVIQVILAPEKSAIPFMLLASTTLSLLVSGIIAAVQHRLSWFNAIALENLIWVGNFVTLLSFVCTVIRSHGRDVRDAMLEGLMAVNWFLAVAMSIFLWVSVYSFGVDVLCVRDVLFYFIFWHVASIPLNGVRALALLFYAGILVCASAAYFWLSRRRTLARQKAARTHNGGAIELATASSSSLVAHNPPRPQRSINPTRAIIISYFFIVAFCIPPLELFLREHHEINRANPTWTFGQVVALIAIIPSLLNLILTVAGRSSWKRA